MKNQIVNAFATALLFAGSLAAFAQPPAAAATAPDKALQAQAQAIIDADARLAGKDIRVQVENGVATLTGTVGGDLARGHAAVVVSAIAGITRIVNNVAVQRTSRAEDAALTKFIRTSLRWNWRTRWVAPRITVVVRNGVVTLTGDVDSWTQQREAERLAFALDGVWLVNNQISVHGHIHYPWREQEAQS